MMEKLVSGRNWECKKSTISGVISPLPPSTEGGKRGGLGI